VLIDIHAHVTPQKYLEMCRAGLGGSYKDSFVGYADALTLDERFAMMDEAGVDQQILMPNCAPFSENRDAALAGTRFINDHYQALCADHPERFGRWLSVPLPHVEDALAEVDAYFDDPKVHGISLGCFCLDKSIADAAFEPFYAELNRRKSLVFLHPCQNGIYSPAINDGGLTVCLGASLEDSLSVIQLISAGIPQRYPDIKFVVPHFGGILAMLLNRLDGQLPREKGSAPPSKVARTFYFDTVGWGSKAALMGSVEAFGADQLVTGSDFPILLHAESYKETFDHVRHSGLDPAVAKTIIPNAAQLLGLS